VSKVSSQSDSRETTYTDILPQCKESISKLEPYCSEFLIHAADNEGLQKGIDEKLVQRLAEWCSIPVTYAGGGRNLDDLEAVKRLSAGKVDLTIGSALDCFGGNGVSLEDCVRWNKQQE
jgi:phosphoribosylformimino-5-aminoimidazole carboxamide ribotide isomerase